MRIAPAVAATALAVATLASPAAASPNALNAEEECGYYTRSTSAFYNHCAPDGTHVVIVVRRTRGDEEQCVGPGSTYLGTIFDVTGAWYNGKLC